MNNNNKTNNNTVRAFSELIDNPKTDGQEKIKKDMVTYEDILKAVDDCMRHKRNKASAVLFDARKEEEILRLVEDINSRTYRPSKAIAFVVTKPKPREVFAPSFRDRVVDHYIGLRMMPLLHTWLIPNTYSCMEGRGTQAMVEHIRRAMEENKGLWVAKWDVSGYFNSIDRRILEDKVFALVEHAYAGEDKEDLLFLIDTTISCDPTQDCELHSPREMWRLIPPHRSLFKRNGRGLAIGRLVAQIYGNIYLNDIDHWCNGRFKAYARYVDDMVAVDTAQNIKDALPRIRAMMADIGLTMHPDKFYMQPVRNGVDVLGTVLKQGRRYVRNSTLRHILKTAELPYSERNAARLNGALGVLKSKDAYDIRRLMADNVDGEWYRQGYFTTHIGHWRKKKTT